MSVPSQPCSALPCPFCGRVPKWICVLRYYELNHAPGCYVSLRNPHIPFGERGKRETVECIYGNEVKAWNSRPNTPREVRETR